jgi:non-ribosomal peptide synthetase component F
VSYLAIITLIKGESVIIESTCNSKSSVHFIHDFFSLSILDVISITTKQAKGPPGRVIKHLLHIGSLSYSISYHDTSSSPVASSKSFDLHLCIDSDFVLQWLYSSAYDLNVVMAYEERFLFMIEQVIDKWNGLVETLQLLDDRGINEILHIGRSPVKDQTMMFIYESIELNAARNPDKVALESGCNIMTYKSLVHRMTAVACVLQAVGVAPDDIVGILMNRGCDLVAALLGKEHLSR